jgi:threonine dehydratase
MIRPSFDDIRAAEARIGGAIMNTPCVRSETLSAIAGCELFLKFENLQFTASFKERGALNKLLQLQASGGVACGVCAVSAGNHAQALAYHARRLRVPATIYMPRGTPMTKVARTRDHGAEVVLEGTNLSEALAAARVRCDAERLTFVHPFDDPDVIAGQGTLALEILAATSDIDVMVVPIGGGGLIAGVAIALKTLKPQMRLIGVQSSTYPSMVVALDGSDEPIGDGMTIAEGIAVKTAGMLTREIIRSLVDDIVLVDEPSIERAVALLLSVEKTVVEGAGAAGLAAILEHPQLFTGKRVATLLTGGNIDLRMLASVAMRELVRCERLLRFEVPIHDRPGALSVLVDVLAREGANIVDLSHDRLSLSLNPKGATLDTVVEVENSSHGARVLAALARRGFGPIVKPFR